MDSNSCRFAGSCGFGRVSCFIFEGKRFFAAGIPFRFTPLLFFLSGAVDRQRVERVGGFLGAQNPEDIEAAFMRACSTG
jgi:hypothetical protein